MSDRDEAENDVQEDLELRDEDAANVIGGETKAPPKPDPPLFFKYDLKAQKEP